MASSRGFLNIQSLNELTYKNVPTVCMHVCMFDFRDARCAALDGASHQSENVRELSRQLSRTTIDGTTAGSECDPRHENSHALTFTEYAV